MLQHKPLTAAQQKQRAAAWRRLYQTASKHYSFDALNTMRTSWISCGRQYITNAIYAAELRDIIPDIPITDKLNDDIQRIINQFFATTRCGEKEFCELKPEHIAILNTLYRNKTQYINVQSNGYSRYYTVAYLRDVIRIVNARNKSVTLMIAPDSSNTYIYGFQGLAILAPVHLEYGTGDSAYKLTIE